MLDKVYIKTDQKVSTSHLYYLHKMVTLQKIRTKISIKIRLCYSLFVKNYRILMKMRKTIDIFIYSPATLLTFLLSKFYD